MTRLAQKVSDMLKLKGKTIKQGTSKYRHKRWYLITRFARYCYVETYLK